MLKVMLIDDEPFILQGLQILVDWAAEGYEIAALMSNGVEALDYLRSNKVDLIISDIQMPSMTGLELLDAIKDEKASDAHFAILTGYDDFSYIQKAIRSNCMDYILKPVQKEDLLSLLRKVSNFTLQDRLEKEKAKKMEAAYLARNIISLLNGKFDDSNVSYVNNHLLLSGNIRYIDIETVEDAIKTEDEEYDARAQQQRLYSACTETQKEIANHFIFDVSNDENRYDVGFIYCDNMAARHDMEENMYLRQILDRIETMLGTPVRMLCGKRVSSADALSKSYSSCCMLGSIKGFHRRKSIYTYEEEMQVEQNSMVLCKDALDRCIRAIEGNLRTEIEESVELLYEEMKSLGRLRNVTGLNINYLLFQLIHLASKQDSEVNQEEIVSYISEHSFENSFTRGSSEHMKRFAVEYSDYLMGLRKNLSGGILSEVERDIKEHYNENISLKSLGEKYFINSAYLGQCFRNKYNMAFKDYLTDYRIGQAAKLLKTTDKKIGMIAEEVGYKDCDYFIRQFIKLKGLTPSKFRKSQDLSGVSQITP